MGLGPAGRWAAGLWASRSARMAHLHSRGEGVVWSGHGSISVMASCWANLIVLAALFRFMEKPAGGPGGCI